MFLALEKNKGKFSWTKHSEKKMRQYQLSKKRVLRVLRHPDRKEIGIAPGTIAAMQITGTKKHPTEIWLMYQIIKQKAKVKAQKIRIISTWRYPGRTPIGEPPSIPDDILKDLLFNGKMLKLK